MPIAETPYIRDAGKCFGPVMFPGEMYNFYINADEPLSDPNYNTFRLDIIDMVTGEVMDMNIGTLQRDEINDYFYNLKCSFTCPVLRFGWYRLVIRDTSSDTVKAVSNPIQIEEPEHVKTTALIAYRHTENKYNFRYEENPDFYNRIRVPVVQVDYSFENNRKQYEEVSTYRIRNEYSRQRKLATLESHQFSEAGHDAMNAVYDHDTIFINNSFIIPKGNYDKEQSRQSAFSNGTIDVYIDPTVSVPAQALTPEEYLVTNEMEEITADGDFIIIKY